MLKLLMILTYHAYLNMLKYQLYCLTVPVLKILLSFVAVYYDEPTDHTNKCGDSGIDQETAVK